MKAAFQEKISLAEATADLVESLHQKFQDIKTHPVAPYEDEDFAMEVVIPKSYNAEAVEEACNRKCIELEDKYNVYILTRVISQ